MIHEDALPAGWTLTGIACPNATVEFSSDGTNWHPTFTAGDNRARVTLAAGNDVTCTFTNTKEAKLTVVKDTAPANSGADQFDFTTTGQADYKLDTDGNDGDGARKQETFTYTTFGQKVIHEDALPAGWTLTGIACPNATVEFSSDGTNWHPTFTAGDNRARVTLAAGNDVTCTYTNRALGSVTIVKETDPDEDPNETDFSFTSDLPGSGNDSFTLQDDGSQGPVAVSAGSYQVTEGDPAGDGYELADITCSDEEDAEGASTDAGATATINVQAGEDVTCTYTNRALGSVTIVKETDPDEDPNETDFSFTSDLPGSGNDSFTLQDDGSQGPVAVSAGSYQVTEGDPAGDGYELADITCSDEEDAEGASTDAGATATINVQAGEDVTCTYTNRALGSVTIVKETDPDEDPNETDFSFTSDLPGSGNDSFTLQDDGSQGPVAVSAGSYQVTEGDPAGDGYELADITCSDEEDAEGASTDAGATATINVQAGEDVTCTYTNRALGSVTIVKETDPDEDPNETDFSFTSDLPGSGNDSFTLQDDGSQGPVAVSAGSYQVTEGDPAGDGYELADITCSDEEDAEGASTDAGATATINVQAGEDVTCTYTNRALGSVTIVKETDPDEDPNETDFSFTSDLPGSGNDSFTLQDDGSQGPVAVSAGSYQVTEGDPAGDGYELADITCSDEEDAEGASTDAGATATINVQAGEDVTCTYTNRALGSVTIVKETDPDEDPNETDFSFTSDLPGSGNDSFTLQDDGSQGPVAVSAGSYQVTEGDPAGDGYELADITCSDEEDAEGASTDAGATATINVQAGEDVTCTYTNRALGSVTIVKETDPDEDPNETDFSFTSDLPGSGNDSFTLQDDGSQGPVAVSAGSYQVTEGDPAGDGYELADITCSDEEDAEGASTDAGATATINVQAGEDVTCTYTNRALGSVTIVKETDPDEDPNETDFSFTSDLPGSGNDSFTLQDDGSQGPVAVSAGSYQVTEGDPAGDGYELADITCSDEEDAEGASTDAGATATINVQAGEDVTCTYTNRALGSVTIVKETDPDEDPNETDFSFTSDLPGSGNDSFTLQDDGSQGPVAVSAGSYQVTEGDPAGDGYELADITCSDEEDAEGASTDAGATATINVQAGEDVTCTYTNRALGSEQGQVVVEKQTDPDGATQSFTFDPGAGLSPADDFELTDGATEEFDVDPGTYTVAEEGEAGWSLDTIVCDDANSTGSGDTATFNVEAGETVTCTFNNEETPGGGGGPDASIELRKELDPTDDPGRFDLLIRQGQTTIGSEQGAGNGGTTGAIPVDSGTYEVSEETAAGTDLSDYQKSIRCIDTARNDEVVLDQPADDPSAEVQVDDNDNIVCTITNTREQGKLELVKDLDPNTDAGRFDLFITRGQITVDSLDNAGDGGTTGENTVSTGTYTVAEEGGDNPVTSLANYQKSIRCIDTARSDEVVVEQPADDPSAEVQVDQGDDIVCTITNRREEDGPRDATVIVNKEAVPESTQDFSFVTSGGFTPGSFELEDDGDEDDGLGSTQRFIFSDSDFDDGGESITEQPQSGWAPDVTCTGDDDFSASDSGRTANLNVEPGERIVCDFENVAEDGGTAPESGTRGESERDPGAPVREERESDGGLPFTGAQLGLILAVGLGLLGSGLVLARRRRRVT